MANGSVRVEPSENSAPYAFSWSGPAGFNATTKDISGLVAREYTLTNSHKNGCTETTAYILNQHEQLRMTTIPSISLDGAHNIDCAGGATGYIIVEVENNLGSVNYRWLDRF